MNDKIIVSPQAAWLTQLREQRDKIDAAIRAIEALEGIALSGGPTILSGKPEQQPPNGDVEIAVDAFHQMTVGQAIRKYLGMRNRKPATTQEIIEALSHGGQAGAEGSNFNVVVNNTLNRLQGADGAISKVKRGLWGLREWYGSHDE